ncbi:SH3 domain-containing protein [Sulfitobacter sabulilitoris]|uniref:SH3 domain-containing protein n=1 Tax=Sulfitobacter sabulilitoris TaxID=2562655 RepID=A0A5S3PLB1_9RHOB|nr:SH3 domain-containing protein [Sulfitobacter sabulilitoris]TMM53006.1 SH3 domain-containing protein [Sulfitobacter sabulilitoris]
MTRLILISFGFLGWAFYEMSGGSDFDPVAARNDRIADRNNGELRQVATATEQTDTTPQVLPEVARASLNLSTLDEVLEAGQQPAAQATADVPVTVSDDSAGQSGIVLANLNAGASFDVQETSIILPSLIEPSEPVSTSAEPKFDIRAVAGTLVNLRGGPGTGFGVVDQLSEGTEVEILQDPGNGWVELRPVSGGTIGWMADFLLTGG